MKIEKITSGILDVNTYIIINEDKSECVIIDGGEDFSLIINKAKELNVKIVALLLSHAHFDHAGNAAEFQKAGVPIYIGEKDAEKLKNGETLSSDFGRPFNTLSPDFTVKDGDVLNLAGLNIKVIETAGHTDGSVTYAIDNCLFSGDTLFFGSFGRTDFPTGSFSEMKKSLKKLFAMGDGFIAFPGHGENTTVKFERINNQINFYDQN